MGLYIIGNINKNICKIGVSQDVYKRLNQIQTSCFFDLSILFHSAELGYHTERQMHSMYKSDKLRGEWFRINKDIKSMIDEYKSKNDSKIMEPRKNIKTIPSIDEISYHKQHRKKRKKNNTKYIKSIFNHR